MAKAFLGSIGEFDSTSELFVSYLERIEQFFVANDVGIVAEDATEAVKKAADQKKVAVMISVIGKKSYNTLRDLCSPASPKDKSFDELCTILKDHYKPRSLEVAGTYKFHQCVQVENESVTEYSARLRHLASDCNFGTFLERSLRDQFISGVRNSFTRKKLLDQDRSFQDALKVAVADEIAQKETAMFQQRQGSQPVNMVKSARVRQRRGNPQRQTTASKPQQHTNGSKPQQQNTASTSRSTYKCYSCGGTNHQRDNCRHRDKTCNKCKKKGHLAKVCRQRNVNTVDKVSVDEVSDNDCGMFTIYDVNTVSQRDISVPLKIENNDVKMQLDTGCAFSIIPKRFYDQYCANVPLSPTTVVLSTYTGEQIHPLGEATVKVTYSGTEYALPLIVVPRGSTALFGRNWLQKITLDWKNLPGLKQVNQVQVPPFATTTETSTSLESLLHKYNNLFDEKLGRYNGPAVDLKVNSQPKFFKPRPVPYALRDKVEKALHKLENERVIEKVSTAPCAAPIVIVGKRNSDDIRVCGDFSVTYNSCADVETYPLPKIEDIYEVLRGSKVFSILDMSQAYHQVPVTPESQPNLTVNTHLGLYSFKRLPNGVHSGPAIFQRIMDTTLKGIDKCVCYIDDILVSGATEEEHLQTLSTVFERLDSAGFKLNQQKCKFKRSSVTYLGYTIDGEGLHPTEEKLRAIRDAPRPKDVTALKSFLGLIMFYSRFLQNHATVLAPLNNLLRKDVKWKWTQAEEKAFQKAKKLLLNSRTLVPYDDSLPLYLACDASSYGAGAVLSHVIDGYYRPIAFASCTLTPAQKNYSQLEKEAFSIIFGLKRFRQYLYGRSFTILTDHRPLLALLAPDRQVPVHAAARLQRWALILQSYNYKIQYRNTTAHADADLMSRLPLPQTWAPKSENVECFFFEDEEMSTVTSEMIKKQTAVDPVYSRVFQYTISGWPAIADPSCVPFKSKQHELTVEQGCLLWGTRVVVPPSLQQAVLNELHETHPGITKMKALARSYVWWPNIDKDIERTVQQYHVCQSTRSNPPEAPTHPWSYPSHPWSRIHIDFAGPVAGRMYLVVVDAYSKYPEIVKMTSITAQATIAALREIFSRQGFPEMIVSDNGSQFTSDEFKQFCVKNGVRHRTSAPYKPSTNGQAERVVQVLKTAIEQANVTKSNVDIVIARYMLVYRNTPHTTTGESPAMMFLKRRLRTRLDLLSPSVRNHVESKQSYTIDRTSQKTLRKFLLGDTVMARNYARGEKWMPGKIIEVVGSRHYIVDVQGRRWKRHVDQIIKYNQVQGEIPTERKFTTDVNMPVSTSPVAPPLPIHVDTSSVAGPSTLETPELPSSQGTTPQNVTP